MTDDPVDVFELRIDRVDVTAEGDETWTPEIVKRMHEGGFSMKGGIYVWLSMRHASSDDIALMGHAVVARQIRPKVREPENGNEAGKREFMDYCCFHKGGGGTLGWGASLVNSMIAANGGKLPEHWLTDGMKNLKTPERQH